MLEWMTDSIFRFASWVTHWFYAGETPRLYIMSGMVGLALIVLGVLSIVLWQNWKAAAEDETPQAK